MAVFLTTRAQFEHMARKLWYGLVASSLVVTNAATIPVQGLNSTVPAAKHHDGLEKRSGTISFPIKGQPYAVCGSPIYGPYRFEYCTTSSVEVDNIEYGPLAGNRCMLLACASRMKY